jgi:hypothetical protein
VIWVLIFSRGWLSSLLKSFQELARYQNDFFDPINVIKEISGKNPPQFDLEINNIRNYEHRAEILLLASNPYERVKNESFSDWKIRSTNIHNFICQYKKIIAVSKYAYKALVFKHSQKIYLSELPKSLKIYYDRMDPKGIENNKIIYVVDYHEIYQSNQNKITISGLINIVQIKKDINLTNHEYQILLNAKVVYWMSKNQANFEGIAITPNLLSLSGILVNIHSKSKFKTYNGSYFNEILSGVTNTKKSKINTKNNSHSEDRDIIVTYLRNHL